MTALLIKNDAKRPDIRVIFAGETRIGSINETTYRNPAMRFYWKSDDGIYGHAETFQAALKDLSARIPSVVAEAEQVALDSAAFAALPDHIQDLVINERRARFELMREERRTIVNEVKLSVAKGAWEYARDALAAAQAEQNAYGKAA